MPQFRHGPRHTKNGPEDTHGSRRAAYRRSLSFDDARLPVGDLQPWGHHPHAGLDNAMKIARFNGGRIGLVIDGAIRDVTAAAGVDPAEWPPVGPVRLIANFDTLRDQLVLAAQ